MSNEEAVSLRIRKEDWEVLDFLSKELKIPKIELISTCMALLCLLVLKGDEIHRLFIEVIEVKSRGRP